MCPRRRRFARRGVARARGAGRTDDRCRPADTVRVRRLAAKVHDASGFAGGPLRQHGRPRARSAGTRGHDFPRGSAPASTCTASGRRRCRGSQRCAWTLGRWLQLRAQEVGRRDPLSGAADLRPAAQHNRTRTRSYFPSFPPRRLAVRGRRRTPRSAGRSRRSPRSTSARTHRR